MQVLFTIVVTTKREGVVIDGKGRKRIATLANVECGSSILSSLFVLFSSFFRSICVSAWTREHRAYAKNLAINFVLFAVPANSRPSAKSACCSKDLHLMRCKRLYCGARASSGVFLRSLDYLLGVHCCKEYEGRGRTVTYSSS